MPPKRTSAAVNVKDSKQPVKKQKTKEDVVPLTMTQTRARISKFGFWKGYEYWRSDKCTVLTKKKNKDGELVIKGECKGTAKEPYEVCVTTSQDNSGTWTGCCTCENSAKKKQVCSHQVAIILEWVDNYKVANGMVKQSQKKEKRPKTFPISAKDKARMKKIKESLSSHTIEELKVMLRNNNLTITGTKPVLLERIADAKALGCTEKCSECGGGRPVWDEHGYWVCNGYMDDDTWQDCSFVGDTIVRRPWKQGEEEVSESESD